MFRTLGQGMMTLLIGLETFFCSCDLKSENRFQILNKKNIRNNFVHFLRPCLYLIFMSVSTMLMTTGTKKNPRLKISQTCRWQVVTSIFNLQRRCISQNGHDSAMLMTKFEMVAKDSDDALQSAKWLKNYARVLFEKNC